MNGVHDMGGMHGMGPIEYDKSEPVFHEPWEGRAYALMLVMEGRGRRGSFRYELELIPPADYLRMSYYERWFTVLVDRLLRSSLVTRAELDSARPDPGSPKPALPPTPEPGARVGSARRARFEVGQRVRARNIHPIGHTRLPRYTRSRRGTIVRDHGAFALQDTDLNGDSLGEKPQHVYTVQFAARELWGDPAGRRDAVYVDLWEDYLERA